jgi:hypothetical protein
MADLYTKIVLTVIAVALTVIAGQTLVGLSTPALAQTPQGPMKVVICDSNNQNRCVGVSDKGWLDVASHS